MDRFRTTIPWGKPGEIEAAGAAMRQFLVDEARTYLAEGSPAFGLKPVISITHTVLRRRDGLVAFASKQVYVSHYFDASLGMALFLPEPGTPYGYVTYMNRSRVEALHGILAPLARRAAARRGREGLGLVLIDVKRKLEQSQGQ